MSPGGGGGLGGCDSLKTDRLGCRCRRRCRAPRGTRRRQSAAWERSEWLPRTLPPCSHRPDRRGSAGLRSQRRAPGTGCCRQVCWRRDSQRGEAEAPATTAASPATRYSTVAVASWSSSPVIGHLDPDGAQRHLARHLARGGRILGVGGEGTQDAGDGGKCDRGHVFFSTWGIVRAAYGGRQTEGAVVTQTRRRPIPVHAANRSVSPSVVGRGLCARACARGFS